jgi:hypothetical protein
VLAGDQLLDSLGQTGSPVVDVGVRARAGEEQELLVLERLGGRAVVEPSFLVLIEVLHAFEHHHDKAERRDQRGRDQIQLLGECGLSCSWKPARNGIVAPTDDLHDLGACRCPAPERSPLVLLDLIFQPRPDRIALFLRGGRLHRSSPPKLGHPDRPSRGDGSGRMTGWLRTVSTTTFSRTIATLLWNPADLCRGYGAADPCKARLSQVMVVRAQ